MSIYITREPAIPAHILDQNQIVAYVRELKDIRERTDETVATAKAEKAAVDEWLELEIRTDVERETELLRLLGLHAMATDKPIRTPSGSVGVRIASQYELAKDVETKRALARVLWDIEELRDVVDKQPKWDELKSRLATLGATVHEGRLFLDGTELTGIIVHPHRVSASFTPK